MPHHLIALIVILFSTACGFTDEGSGSGTLQVKALVDYVAGSTDTSLVVISIVGNSELPVAKAEVTLTDHSNGETFVFRELMASSGIYTGSFKKYRRLLELKIFSHHLSVA